MVPRCVVACFTAVYILIQNTTIYSDNNNRKYNTATVENKNTKNKILQTSKYERVDSEEHAYQKLETAYTAKAELAAGNKAGVSKGKGKRAAPSATGSGTAEGADSGGRQKEKAGRWFD